MNPHSKPRPLFFTPRSPWGGRLESQSFRRHMRASEDKKLQGLGGQMASSQPDGSGGQTSQTGGNVWKVPHTDLQPYLPPQQPAATPPSEITKTVAVPANPATAEQMRQAADPYRITPPAKGPVGRFLEHFDGGASYEGVHPGTEEPPGKEWWMRYSTNPNAREEQPNFDAPERHEGNEQNWRYLNRDKPPGEGAQPKPPRRKKAGTSPRR